MIEKIGFVKNPLTVIAIFAGIAEVSGTIVLPFVDQTNQLVFIYFLIFFPTLLVCLFFLTLNFNNKVLYAPSDYKDETNFIKLTRFDSAKQKLVQIELDTNQSTSFIVDEISSLKESLNKRIDDMKFVDVQEEAGQIISRKGKDYSFLVRNFQNVTIFTEKMDSLGYNFQIYNPDISKNDFVYNVKEGKSIWLGSNIPFDIAKEVILESKKVYPQLQYIWITGDLNHDSPLEVYDEIFIGGSTESAIKFFKLNPISDDQFQRINELSTLNELHQLIRQSYQ